MFGISYLPTLSNEGLIYKHTCLGKTQLEDAADAEAGHCVWVQRLSQELQT